MLTGVMTGILCALYHFVIQQIEAGREGWFASNEPTLFSLFILVSISASFSAFAFYLVKRFSPESAGSGIQEIEGMLAGVRKSHWQRVLPVKFVSGVLVSSVGFVLGREGPSVQMGGAMGAMFGDLSHQKTHAQQTLIASGAAAGLAAVFNAPLAGILFVLEEMREQFHCSLFSLKVIILAVLSATLTMHYLIGNAPVFELPALNEVPLASYWLFFVLGLLFGLIGVLFNKLVLVVMDCYLALHQDRLKAYVILGAFLGGSISLLVLFFPQLVGDGKQLIPDILEANMAITALLALFLLRFMMTLVCFCSGATGGVFAPMLSLGALVGGAFGQFIQPLFPAFDLSIGFFVVAGMCAFFCATVRAPLTAIVLIIELTREYDLIFPLLITALGAVLAAKALGGKAIYTTLLARTLAKSTRHKQMYQVKQN